MTCRVNLAASSLLIEAPLARTPEMAEQAPAPLHVAILGAGPIGLEQPWMGLPLSADIHPNELNNSERAQ